MLSSSALSIGRNVWLPWSFSRVIGEFHDYEARQSKARDIFIILSRVLASKRNAKRSETQVHLKQVRIEVVKQVKEVVDLR
jgi:hypothetical protein